MDMYMVVPFDIGLGDQAPKAKSQGIEHKTHSKFIFVSLYNALKIDLPYYIHSVFLRKSLMELEILFYF